MQNVQPPVGNNAFLLTRSWAFYIHESSSVPIPTLPPKLCYLTLRVQLEHYELFSARAIEYVGRCDRQKHSTLMIVIPNGFEP